MLADRVVLGGAEANTEVSHGRFQRFKALKARAISKEVSFRTRWVRQTYRRLGLPARVSLFSEPYGGGRHRELRAATERFTTSREVDSLAGGAPSDSFPRSRAAIPRNIVKARGHTFCVAKNDG